MKKNHDLHFYVEKDLKEKLQKEADTKGISLAELCRDRLREDSQLTRIELVLMALTKRGEDLGKRSSQIRRL